MTFKDFEKALSKSRLSRYLSVCNGDDVKALELYRLNIQLSKEIFGMLSIFEVVLRNAIDEHYKKSFASTDWLKLQANSNGVFSNAIFKKGNFKTRTQINDAIKGLSIYYSHDHLIASLTMGFYVHLFNPIQFRLAGQSLHRIFVKRPKGTLPKDIFDDLVQIKDFRNRIAHQEPLCFNAKNQIDTTKVKDVYLLILKYTQWLDYDTNYLYHDLDNTSIIIQKIILL